MNPIPTRAYLVTSRRGESVYLDSERAQQVAQDQRGEAESLVAMSDVAHLVAAMEPEAKTDALQIAALRAELDATKKLLSDAQIRLAALEGQSFN